MICLATLWNLTAVGVHSIAAAPTTAEPQPPPGIEKRIPLTTSRILGSPEPPSPYVIERLFPKLAFSNAVDLAQLPGSDRLLVAELGGRIFSFPTTAGGAPTDLLADLKQEISGMEQLYGFTFHPKFQENRFIYICYVLKSDLPDGSRVSRFTVSRTEPPKLELKSESILITWLSGGHNGGCLKFGPDGYLYISTGDGAGPNPPDPLKTGQDNSDLLSAILRIDVDRTDEARKYRIPSDNPFANLPGTRPEIWSYGFRNPWRMSFDQRSGDLWAGDVGWELWELVFRIQRGGNYGWSIVEGPQSIHPDWPRGPTPILPPMKAHPHSEAASITGGFVYRGSRFKELAGAYVYGDWVTGKIWALRNDGDRVTSLRELVDTPLQIICFGEDPSDELFILDYNQGIYRLAPNPTPDTSAQFPRKLSETGLFDSVQHHLPAPGVIPFLINAEMWADHALAERFVALPENSFIQTGATNVWLYQSKNEWRYPTNAVLAKTLFLQTEQDNTKSLRRVETQVLHYDGLDWHAYTYRWNDDESEAFLVDAAGDDRIFEVKDPAEPGGIRKQAWRFHGRAECLRCHNPWMNYALAFTAPQLNRPVQYQSNHPVCASLPILTKPAPWPNDAVTEVNQLRTFSRLGFFDQPLDERARPKFNDPYETGVDSEETAQPAASSPTQLPQPQDREDLRAARSAKLEERARAWLHVNCAHCHREGAGGSVVTHLDYDTKLADMKAIGRLPSQGTLGLTGAHVITPGDPYSSVLYYRILTTGQGRMPHIGSQLVDTTGAKLIHDWIAQLPEELSEDKTEDPAAENLRAANAESLKWVWSLVRDGRSEINRLLATPNGALALLSTVDQGNTSLLPGRRNDVVEKAASHSAYQVRDLFERFLPDERRPKKLGAMIKPNELLALRGDAGRGERIFFQEGASQCQQCHRIKGQGRDFGPDLSHIAAKYDRAQILDNILFPSKNIDPNYLTYQLETRDELSYNGFLLNRTEEEVVLKDPNSLEIRVRRSNVKSLEPQQISAMPELLLQSMTAQDVADLLEFLATLK